MTSEQRIEQALGTLLALPTNEALAAIWRYVGAELSEYSASDLIYDGIAGLLEDLASEPDGATDCLYPITISVREPDPRLMELLLADRPLTAEEWAEIKQLEKGERQ